MKSRAVRDPLLERLRELGGSEEVRAQARRRVTAYGLSADLGADVLQRALLTAHRRVEEGKIDDEQHLEKLLSRALKFAAIDVFRGTIRRAEVALFAADDDGSSGPLPGSLVDGADPVDAHLAAATAQGLRAAVVRAAAGPPASPALGAAALAVIAFAQSDDLADPPGAPAPKGRGEQRQWSSLWLAGYRCFATPDPPAQRQQRSRLLKKLDGLLRAAAAEAGVVR